MMELPFREVSAVSAVFLPTTGPRSPLLRDIPWNTLYPFVIPFVIPFVL